VLARGKYQRFDEMVAEPQSYGWLKALLRGSEVLAKLEPGEVLYYGDGISGFTTVLKYTGPLGNTEYSLSISGKMDASSRGDMKTQTLSAHFPMIFHRNPKTVMVLGLASGISAGETLYYPIEKLDVLEISPEVVAASRFFNSWNNNVLSDPRTELIVQDGLAHLQLTNRRYDIIISEPSNPWMAGIAALFTREFFVLARERLNVDGIFCQWLHSYQMDWPTFALVGRTFAQVFPNSLLFSTNPSLVGNDYLLVGFKGEGKLSLADTEGKLPFIRQLKNATLTDPKLLYRQIASQDLQELFGPGPVNTAIRPSLEFAAPKLMYQSDPNILIGIRSRKRLTPETADVVRQVTTDVDAQIEFAAFALSLYCPFPNMVDLSAATPAQKERFYKLMERYCADNPVDYSILRDEELAHRCRLVQIKAIEGRVGDISDTDTLGLSYFYLADLYSREGMFEQCINYYSKYLKIKPDSEVACHNIAQAMAAQGKYNEALVFYRDAVRLKPDFAEAYLGIAMALSMEGKVDESVTYFNEALRIRPDFVEARTFLGTALLEQGKLDQAIAQFTIALEADPNLAEVHANLGAALTNQGKFNEAIRHYREALRIKPDFAEAHSNLGMALAIQGKLDEAIIHFTQAIKIKPELPDVHYNLGLALSRQQRVDEAIAQFEEVLRLDPQYKGARQALDTLLQLRKTRSAK
jgi:spermidine synthase